MKTTTSHDAFLFVNAGTLAEGGVDAKRQIRSLLMRRVYRKRELSEDDSASSSSLGRNHRNSDYSQQASPILPALIQSPTKILEKSVSNGAENSSSTATKRTLLPEAGSSASGRFELQLATSDPLAALGVSKIDPFYDRGSTFSLPHYDELCSHFFSVIMPSFRSSHDWANRLCAAYLDGSRSILLLNVLCLCSSAHLRHVSRRNDSIHIRDRSLEEMYYRNASLTALRRALSGPVLGQPIFDEILACICILAINERLGVWNPCSPFPNPLLGLGGLDYYRFGCVDNVHWAAIQTLLDQNGGLETVELFGLRWMLSYTSLKYAVHNSSKPELPMLNGYGADLGQIHISMLLGSSTGVYHADFLEGFRLLRLLTIKESIIQTFVDLHELSYGTQHLFQEGANEKLQYILTDARNLFQHRFLKLPLPCDEFANIFDDSHTLDELLKPIAWNLYRCCWLAASIFSKHVTFPLPSSSDARRELVPKLQAALSNYDHAAGCVELDKILLWCTLIGGIASRDTDLSLHEWYSRHLRMLSVRLGLQSWQYVRDILCTFAWTNGACEEGGYVFWLHSTGLEQYTSGD